MKRCRTNPNRHRTRPVALDPWELEYIRYGLAPDVLWEAVEWLYTYGHNPARTATVMEHLREPVRLPR